MFRPSVNQIAFATLGTEAFRVDNSQRLLVGTSTSVSNLLQGGLQIVGTSEDSYITATRYSSGAGGAPGIVLGRSKSATKGTNTIVASGDTLGVISFSGANGTSFDQAASIAALVDGTPGASGDMPGRLVFSTTADGASSPTEQLRITSDRYIRLASGTGGIQFGGDIGAASALDDYEEGTWTPVVEGTTTAGTGTYTVQVGRYTKTGNRVQYNLVVLWTAHTGTGNLRVAGLPFTSQTTNNNLHPAAIFSNNLTTPANHYPVANVSANSTLIVLNSVATGGSALTVLAMDTAATLYISGHYETAT
jgi:hypothetical protein